MFLSFYVCDKSCILAAKVTIVQLGLTGHVGSRLGLKRKKSGNVWRVFEREKVLILTDGQLRRCADTHVGKTSSDGIMKLAQ